MKKYKNTRVNINSIDRINNNYNYYCYMLVSTFDGFKFRVQEETALQTVLFDEIYFKLKNCVLLAMT